MLKSASSANKFVFVMERVLMKLEAKLFNLVGIKAELLKRLQRAWGVKSPIDPQQNGVVVG